MTTFRWALASLISAVIWLFFSIIPGGILTTLPGVPFAIFSFIAGWLSRRQAQTEADSVSVRNATIGLGVSCFGCLWQVVYYAIWGGIAVAALVTLWNTVQTTPTPIP